MDRGRAPLLHHFLRRSYISRSTRLDPTSYRRWCSRSLAQQNLVLPVRSRIEIHKLKLRARASGKANLSDQLFHPVICSKTSRNSVLANLLTAEFESCGADHRDYACTMFLLTGSNVPKVLIGSSNGRGVAGILSALEKSFVFQ